MAKRKGTYARDIDRMNVVFAAVAIGSLVSVLWMIWDDYARQWKSYQRQFRTIEQEVVRSELQTVQAQVDQQRLAQLTQQRDAAEQQLQQQQDTISALEEQLADVETRLELTTTNFRFGRSIYDARRWEYEEAARHSDADASSERAAMEEAARRVRETEELVEELTAEQERLARQLATVRGAYEQAQSEITATTREIDRLQERLDDLRFGFVYYVRNAPVLDAFNPSLTIQQAVLADLPMDLNFAAAPRVDRCQTCHMGAGNEAFSAQQQPFASHPRLDLYVADTAVHPAGEFGCSVCHSGKGRATSFQSAVHTPSTESEQERWEDEYGWAPEHLWEWPMRPSFETEAGCLKCHMADTWIPDAPTLEYGLGLIENLGCHGCHALERFEDARKTGPDLASIGSKVSFEWAWHWIMDPKSFRPNTPMPRFFNLANTDDEYWQRRNVVEVDGILAYLFDNSTEFVPEAAPRGDAARGEQIVASVGCLGCHIVEEPGSSDYPADEPRFAGYRQQGPNLFGVGSKVSADWLYTWVRDPKHYWADTVMPNLRLTDQEAADVAAYLADLRWPDWEELAVPEPDAELRDEVVLEYLRNQLSGADAQARLAEMGPEEKRTWLGEQLIGRYGCFACHIIPGFESRGRIGTELSSWGSKAVTQLDFGLLDMPHERRAFLEQKLRAPRSYDEGKVREPQELLRMPNFQLTEEEIDAIATTILGYTDEEIPPAKKPEPTPRKVAMEEGRRLAQKYNCRGCHILEGAGGAIREVIAANRMAAQGVTRPSALAFAPPELRTQGARTQPDWLYRFLRQPTPVRPWLDVRMPTFGLTDQELNALTQYFSAVDEAPYPFDEKFTVAHQYPRELVRAGERLASDTVLQCFRCHVRGGQNPPGEPSTWAPDLAMAADRLRFEWVVDWIADPQSIMPGTNMPQFFTDLDAPSYYMSQGVNRGEEILDQDPRRQIEAIAAYIMSLGQ